MPADENANKIHVDQDWKAQAQAEKERLEQQDASAGDKPKGGRELPEPDFRGLVGILASQAIMGLGAYGDPKTGKVMIDLDGAQFAIDLLAVLDEKTNGNLTDEESKDLTQVLSELRSQFVHIQQLVAKQGAQQVAQQAQQQQQQGGQGSQPGASKLVQPE